MGCGRGRRPSSLPEPRVDFGRGFVTLDVERRGMTQTQNGPQQQQQQRQRRSRKDGRGHHAGLLIVLALGMGGAGLVLPLNGGDPAEPISMLIVTEDATEGPEPACCSPSRRRQPRRNARSGRNRRRRPSATVEAPTALPKQAVQTCACHVHGPQVNVFEGGLTYAWGLDLDASGTLDANEVLETSFLCHGAEGADGADGQPGLDGQNRRWRGRSTRSRP